MGSLLKNAGQWSIPGHAYEDWFWVLLPWEMPKHIEEYLTTGWCEKNCEGMWARDRIFKVDEAMYFKDESDQVKFILKWM